MVTARLRANIILVARPAVVLMAVGENTNINHVEN